MWYRANWYKANWGAGRGVGGLRLTGELGEGCGWFKANWGAGGGVWVV